MNTCTSVSSFYKGHIPPDRDQLFSLRYQILWTLIQHSNWFQSVFCLVRAKPT